jgi:hypothetical protein
LYKTEKLMLSTLIADEARRSAGVDAGHRNITENKAPIMTKYLISFPATAMKVPVEDMPAVSDASRAVIREAKAAGVYVFAGGINSEVAPVMVAADGSCTAETYRQTREFDGGFCVLELPSRADAVDWAARLAAACRCAQELREFYYDPES